MDNAHDEMAPSRVSVWDADELDKGIYDVLKSQIQNIFSFFPASFTTRLAPEIDASLKTVLWILSVEKSFATFGQQILHLKYDSRTPMYKLRLLGALRIGSVYLKDRLSDILTRLNDSKLSDMGSSAVKRFETVLNLLNILSFVIFLRRGGASTFFEQLLNVRPVSTLRPSERTIGYGFMTRELLWHGLIELLVLVLPLMNFYTMKRLFRKFFQRSSLAIPKKAYLLTRDTLCPICQESPIVPHNMGCAHIFCHYCLASHRFADKNFECPACGFSDPHPSALVPVTR